MKTLTLSIRGLMPIFVPKNSSGYYEYSLYERYRAQGLKEDLWAAQYYFLLQEASTPPDTYLTTTTVTPGTKVYAVMTFNASTGETSNAFFRKQKLGMAEHIGGGNLTEAVVWCSDPGCSLSFPVNRPNWTASALVSLGI